MQVIFNMPRSKNPSIKNGGYRILDVALELKEKFYSTKNRNRSFDLSGIYTNRAKVNIQKLEGFNPSLLNLIGPENASFSLGSRKLSNSPMSKKEGIIQKQILSSTRARNLPSSKTLEIQTGEFSSHQFGGASLVSQRPNPHQLQPSLQKQSEQPNLLLPSIISPLHDYSMSVLEGINRSRGNSMLSNKYQQVHATPSKSNNSVLREASTRLHEFNSHQYINSLRNDESSLQTILQKSQIQSTFSQSNQMRATFTKIDSIAVPEIKLKNARLRIKDEYERQVRQKAQEKTQTLIQVKPRDEIIETNEDEYKSEFDQESNQGAINKASTDSESSLNRREIDVEGSEALQQQLMKYEKSGKILAKSEMRGKKVKDPLVNYINEASTKNLIPRGMGFVHRKDNVHQVNLKSFYVRDDYINAFTKGIRFSNHIEEINLRNIGMTTNRAIKIIQNLRRDKIKQIDFSGNPLMNKVFYQTLAEYIEDEKTVLKRLILEGNKMGDMNLRTLCESLQHSNVTYLNFSKNDLTNLGAECIAKLLPSLNELLNVLFLHWNKISGKGGACLAKAIAKHKSLQIFDISCNSLGSGSLNSFQIGNQIGSSSTEVLSVKKNQDTYISAWKECYMLNSTLLHVDMSNNLLNAQELQTISDGLQSNHTILGIHLIGNEAEVDTKGFVKADKDISLTHASLYTRIAPTLKQGKITNTQLLNLNVSSNCWLCEGWTEVRFEYRPGVSDDNAEIDPEKPIYLHLECDDFQPDLMLPDPSDPTLYVSTRMLPPGIQRYYFKRNEKAVIAKSLPVSSLGQYEILEEVDVPITNILENIAQKRSILNQEEIFQMNVKPREEKTLFKRDKIKTPWDFYKSVFKDYKADTPTTLNNCFEYDWGMTKLENILKDKQDLLLVKELMRANYKKFRETYKHYSGLDPCKDVPSIGTTVFADLVQSCGDLMDSKTLKLADLDLEFVATKSGPKKSNPRNPERSMIRYQIIEVFVRIAGTKFVKSGICSKPSEAVSKLLTEYVGPQFSKFDFHVWRKGQLWCEACDLVYKRNMNAMRALYSKYSGMNALPGAPKFMSLTEFIQLVSDSGAINETFGEREIAPLFTVSMMTQLDEIDNDRFMNMVLVEFLEAFARVADRQTIPNQIDDDPENPPSNLELKKRPLSLKIEAYIMQAVLSCLGLTYFTSYMKVMRKAREEAAGIKWIGQGLPYKQ